MVPLDQLRQSSPVRMFPGRRPAERVQMTRSLSCAGLVAVLVCGCASQAQLLDGMQGMAIQTAVSRGQFEMACPEATGTILSREVVQPAIQGPWLGGIQRAEYTVGVAGCGKRTTFVVICPEGGDGCLATGPGRFIRE